MKFQVEASTELLLFNFQGSEMILEKEQTRKHGGVAQLGEHLPCKQGVMGSNPIISTTRQRRGPKTGKYSDELLLQTPLGKIDGST